VREAGALLILETTVTDLAFSGDKVIGVYTDRAGGMVRADVVVMAEGVNGLLGTRAGLRTVPKPETVALAVKEMHFLPSETIEARFNVKGNEGVVIEAAGTITKGMAGTGFIYTNKESISLGIGCLISDFNRTGLSPYQLLDTFKRHPAVAPLISGSEVKEYSAHLIPEGGYKAVPQLFGDGWLIVGDAGQFVNAVHREGSNLAMTTGRLAAEAIFQIKSRKDEMTAENLSLYQKMIERSFVMKDLKKYKRLPGFLHSAGNHLFGTYPQLVSKAAQTFLRVDGKDKRSKEKEIVRSFVKTRGVLGLAGDAWKFARSWR
jgi:electron transfer flavoprotein-quinone oxidoreductase